MSTLGCLLFYLQSCRPLQTCKAVQLNYARCSQAVSRSLRQNEMRAGPSWQISSPALPAQMQAKRTRKRQYLPVLSMLLNFPDPKSETLQPVIIQCVPWPPRRPEPNRWWVDDRWQCQHQALHHLQDPLCCFPQHCPLFRQLVPTLPEEQTSTRTKPQDRLQRCKRMLLNKDKCILAPNLCL